MYSLHKMNAVEPEHRLQNLIIIIIIIIVLFFA